MYLILKMLYELKKGAAQFLSIFIMSMLALVLLTGFMSVRLEPLERYLSDTNYKAVEITNVRGSNDMLYQIRKISGVNGATGIIHSAGKTMVNGREYKMVLSFVESDESSKMLVKEGSEYTPGQSGVWIDASFAKAVGVQVGDILDIRVGNSTLNQEVKGIVYSPEYLYYMPDSTYVEPVYGEYGFGILDVTEYGGEISFDQINVSASGISDLVYPSAEDKSIANAIADQITKIIDEKSAVVKIIGESEQVKFYVENVEIFQMVGTIFPNIFALIAILGIVSTMSRMISSQRMTIGALKALGFTTKQIILHYISYPVIIVTAGGLIGMVIGYFLLAPINYDNMTYYYLNPYEEMAFSGAAILYLVGLVLVGALATFFNSRKLVSMNASQILQPDAPKNTKQGWYEALALWKKIKFATKWNIRDISNNVLRTLISILGVIVCSLLLFMSFGLYEAQNRAISWEYGGINHYKNQIVFTDKADYGTVRDYAYQYNGQMLQLSPATVSIDGTQHAFSIYVTEGGSLYTYNDENAQYVEPPEHGALITTKFSEVTGYQVGDVIDFKLDGDEKTYSVKIVGYGKHPEPQGLFFSDSSFKEIQGTYLPNKVLTNMSVAKTLVEREEIEAVNTVAELKQAAVNANASLLMYVGVLVILGTLLGVVVQYNLGSMSYSEKFKDLATLKVLGFLAKDLKTILMQQNIMIALIGSIFGMFAGRFSLTMLLSDMGDSVDYIYSVSIVPYIAATIGTVAISAIVNALILSKIDSIELVEALKS